MIRPAANADLPAIEDIYETARAYMRANGNPHQWSDYGYPERELLLSDIAMAGDGRTRGIFTRAFAFALTKTDNVRVDTHHDNKTMQHVILKHGFTRCGVIYLKSGDPRIAYQYSKEA